MADEELTFKSVEKKEAAVSEAREALEAAQKHFDEVNEAEIVEE